MTVQLWRGGGAPTPFTDIASIARGFEDMGWDGFTLPDGPAVSPEAFVGLTAAALGTKRLQVGTAVTIPARHPQLTASAMACVHAVSGRRTLFSVGRGDGGMQMLGRGPLTVAEFEVWLTRLQEYLRGDEVESDGHRASLRKLFESDPSFAFPKQPVDVSASGPRMAAVGGKLAESVTFSVGADENRLVELLGIARDARLAAGLDPATLRTGCYIQVAVTRPGEEGDARDGIRRTVATHSRFGAGHVATAAQGTSAQDDAAIARSASAMREAFRTSGNSGAQEVDFKQVVDDDFVDRFAVVGDAETCARRLQAIIGLGFDRIVIMTKSHGSDPEEVNTVRIAEQVLPLLSRTSPTQHG